MTTEQIAKKVGKRPQTARQISEKLGFPSGSGQAVSRLLGEARKRGLVQRTEKGWVRA